MHYQKILMILILIGLCVLAGAQDAAPKLLSVEKIWEEGGHNAFTDLIRFQDAWYCSFREADGHVKGDGKLRLITSADGKTWESAALLEEEGIDLRDPKLSITPDGRLMMTAGGSVYRKGKLVGRQPRVAFSPDGKIWTTPRRTCQEGDWLWRVTWHEGIAYGVIYRSNDDKKAEWAVELVRSSDGVNYAPVVRFDIPGKPNESTIRFLMDGTMVTMVRREAGNKKAWIGRSQAPYTAWTWKESEHQVGGPDFIVLPDGKMWAGGRAYHEPRSTRMGPLTWEGYDPQLTLPSGGDTSYPGFVWHEGLLWMSYYASHEDKTCIYLAKIALPKK